MQTKTSTQPPDPGAGRLRPCVDFSLVLGGPLYQLLRRTHLSGEGLELVRRRVVALTVIAWVPLLALSLLEGEAWGSKVRMPFLYDAEVHLRFLLALPLLLVAEVVAQLRLQPVVRQFTEQKLIPEELREQFDAAIASALRWRNSILPEVLLIVLVYGAGVLFLWRQHVALNVPSWYGVKVEGKLYPTLAGWWFGCVSLPLFQFLLLRWYYRLLIWARFLWQVSRLDLKVVPTHPDRRGGLGFLALASYAFTPLALAQGALVAGMIANRLLYAGAKLPAFKVDVVALVALTLLVVLGPMLVFAPRLEGARRVALREYSTVGQQYVREFDQKWLRGGGSGAGPLLGSNDIQALADLANSFEVIKSMRWAPFTAQTVVQLTLATVLPVLPLLLTMISAEELIQRILKVIF